MVNDEIRKEISEIIGRMKCPKGFECAESGFERLCRARYCGLDKYLECLEDIPSRCAFAFPFGNRHFCKCSLRVYIAKNLKK